MQALKLPVNNVLIHIDSKAGQPVIHIACHFVTVSFTKSVINCGLGGKKENESGNENKKDR